MVVLNPFLINSFEQDRPGIIKVDGFLKKSKI